MPNVKFRTTDLSYVSGTAVGYSATCGSVLTKYGKTSGLCTSLDCSQTTQTLLVPATSGTTKMWVSGLDICICDSGKTSGYPMKYTTGDLDAPKVDSSVTSIDSSKEVSC
mgnify:CR=1 FL=1